MKPTGQTKPHAEFNRNVGNYSKPKDYGKFARFNVWWAILAAILLNTSITSVIYRAKHPEKTETQAFLHILKSFVYDFR